jgi:hypothetical protein
LFGRHGWITAPIHGRKLVYIFHSRSFLSVVNSKPGSARAGSWPTVIVKKHEFARFSSTSANLSQYRLLTKSLATCSWYRRGHLAIPTPMVLLVDMSIWTEDILVLAGERPVSRW